VKCAFRVCTCRGFWVVWYGNFCWIGTEGLFEICLCLCLNEGWHECIMIPGFEDMIILSVLKAEVYVGDVRLKLVSFSDIGRVLVVGAQDP
jgi:hypothetical protein